MGGDSQSQGKKKRAYEQWTARETQMLTKLLADGIKQGWRDASGCMSKLTVEKKILPVLNSTLRCEKTYIHYESKLRNLINTYNNMQELIKFSWDPTTKKFTAHDHVWDEYERKNMRDETFENYEDLQLIFDIGLATGKYAVGLGDDTDAQTFGMEDNAADELYTTSFGNIGNVDGCQAPATLDSSMPQNKATQAEKLNPKKRSRGGECGDSSKSNMDSCELENTVKEMIEVSNQVVSVIRQKEERQQREAILREEESQLKRGKRAQREANLREVERKKNNLWEAIKEIFGLDENTWYVVLKEIQKQEMMKDVFISMSLEERMSWIKRNVN